MAAAGDKKCSEGVMSVREQKVIAQEIKECEEKSNGKSLPLVCLCFVAHPSVFVYTFFGV